MSFTGCLGCPFYDPDYGCLSVNYTDCPQQGRFGSPSEEVSGDA